MPGNIDFKSGGESRAGSVVAKASVTFRFSGFSTDFDGFSTGFSVKDDKPTFDESTEVGGGGN